MPRAFINADCFSASQRISCRIPVGPAGLIGLLNDTTTSLIEAEDAYISRLQQGAKIVAHQDTISLNKVNLALLILNRREDLGSVALSRGGYTRLTACPVLFTTNAFEIRGVIELAGRLEAGVVLVGGTNRFVPVYKASAVVIRHPDTPYNGEVIVINRTHVVALAGTAATEEIK